MQVGGGQTILAVFDAVSDPYLAVPCGGCWNSPQAGSYMVDLDAICAIVVDETHVTNSRSYEQSHPVTPDGATAGLITPANWLKCGLIPNDCVLDVQFMFSKHFVHGGFHLVDSLNACCCSNESCRLQCTNNAKGSFAFFFTKEHVATAHRQATIFSHGRSTQDDKSRPAIGMGSHHRLEYSQLLPVFLTEDREGGSCKIQEPGDGLADSGEMTGTAGVLQLGVGGDIRQWGEPGAFTWIDGLDLGGEYGGCSGSLCGNQVVLECSRVAIQVSGIFELRRVHEDAHDDIVRMRSHLLDEGTMSAMQCAHGGDETTTLVRLQFLDGGDAVHGDQTREMTSVLFWPPNPNELLRQVSIAVSRFTLGT